MDLNQAIKLAHPLVWIVSSEPYDVLTELVLVAEEGLDPAAPNHKLYRQDAIDGFMVFDPEKGWRQVLLPGDRLSEGLADSLYYLYAYGGILFLEHSHLVAEKLIGLLSSLHMRYMDSIFDDNLASVPPQIIMVSHDEKVPPELAKMVTKEHYSLPDDARFIQLSTHIAPVDTDHAKVARAAAGLGTSMFIRTASASMAETGTLDHNLINREKVAILARDSALKLRQPSLSLDDLGGLDLAKELITSNVKAWNDPEKYAKLGVNPMHAILMIGVSGSGKSALAEATASALGMDLAKFGVSQAMTKWVGESERNMRDAFEIVHRLAPVVLWVDELGRDLSGGASSAEVDGGTTDRVHGEFLTGMQELPDNVFFVAAANRIDGLPPEMTRADRFDKIMFIGFPTHDERVDIFNIHLRQLVELGGEYDLDSLAAATNFFTGAEIKALIKSATFAIATKADRLPTSGEIEAHAPKIKGRVWVNHRDAIVAMYTKAKTHWEWASSAQEAAAEEILASVSAPGQVRRLAKQPL